MSGIATADGPRLRMMGRVAIDGSPDAVAGGRVQQLLCWLVLRANEATPIDGLIARIWGERAPMGARRELFGLVGVVETAVSRLATVERTSTTLALHIDLDEIDTYRLEHTIDLPVDDRGARADQLRGALGLWRGRPYASIAGHPDAMFDVHRLERCKLDAQEELASIRLAANGNPPDGALLADLGAFVARHPERSAAVLLLAQGLDRAGRRVEAIRLVHELQRNHAGFEPVAVQSLEAAILHGSGS